MAKALVGILTLVLGAWAGVMWQRDEHQIELIDRLGQHLQNHVDTVNKQYNDIIAEQMSQRAILSNLSAQVNQLLNAKR